MNKLVIELVEEQKISLKKDLVCEIYPPLPENDLFIRGESPNPEYWMKTENPSDGDKITFWGLTQKGEEARLEYFSSRYVPGYWSLVSKSYRKIICFGDASGLLRYVEFNLGQVIAEDSYFIKDPDGDLYGLKNKISLEKK